MTNFGEHLLRRAVDEHFYDLLVRPRFLAGKHVPGIGLNQVYEQNSVPQLARRRRRCGPWWRRRHKIFTTKTQRTQRKTKKNKCL